MILNTIKEILSYINYKFRAYSFLKKRNQIFSDSHEPEGGTVTLIMPSKPIIKLKEVKTFVIKHFVYQKMDKKKDFEDLIGSSHTYEITQDAHTASASFTANTEKKTDQVLFFCPL